MAHPIAHHTTNSEAKSKGVSTLIARFSPFQLTDKLVDPDGQYLFLKGTFASKPITVANIYCLNEHQVSFFRKVIDLLCSFQSGVPILWGGTSMSL